MNEEKLLLAEADEKIRCASARGFLAYTDFLDVHQKSVIKEHCEKLRVSRYGFYGGYKEAERCLAVFFPEYADLKETMQKDGSLRISSDDLCAYFAGAPEEDPLSCLAAEVPKGSRKLTHRDYLGALMGLGIKRSVAGDILTEEGGAKIVVLKSMEDYILSYFSKAGRENLSVCRAALTELHPAAAGVRLKTDTVASLRLDSVASACFDISRSKAAEAVRMGLIYVNSQETLSPDAPVDEGDILSFRGKGRAVLKETGSRSKKDRIFITIERYL